MPHGWLGDARHDLRSPEFIEGQLAQHLFLPPFNCGAAHRKRQHLLDLVVSCRTQQLREADPAEKIGSGYQSLGLVRLPNFGRELGKPVGEERVRHGSSHRLSLSLPSFSPARVSVHGYVMKQRYEAHYVRLAS